MEKQTSREPILYIVGNKERADEIRHILEIKLGGDIAYAYKCDNSRMAYYVNVFGLVDYCNIDSYAFKKAVANGWMKEYKLTEKPQFKPFDKVVVKMKKAHAGWYADIYSHEDEESIHFVGNNTHYKKYVTVLPCNEQTEKLIGTYDEWKGGEE